MYSNNMIPNYNVNMQRGYGLNRKDERFIGGGFAVPFLLGGLTGGLLARPNNFNSYPVPYPIYQPYPVVTPYSYNQYPSYTENYYYY